MNTISNLVWGVKVFLVILYLLLILIIFGAFNIFVRKEKAKDWNGATGWGSAW